jgi:hypothetical protein
LYYTIADGNTSSLTGKTSSLTGNELFDEQNVLVVDSGFRLQDGFQLVVLDEEIQHGDGRRLLAPML